MNLNSGDTIIIGMDGGMESTVAAYLLKKQGYHCIGVSVIYHEDDNDFLDLVGCCLPDDLDNIKVICKALEIPFYATNASELYFEEVVDPMVSSRLSGTSYEPMVDRVMVIIKTLIDKLKPLGATVVATGHYCKVLKNQTTGLSSLYAGNDLLEDDSYYMSKLPYDLLDQLHFPLAELREQEVLKIAALIPVKFKFDKKLRRSMRLSLMQADGLIPLVEKYTALKLRNEGIVVNHADLSTVGDHLGIHQFYIGQSKISLKSRTTIDKESEVIKIVPSNGMVYMEKSDKVFFTHCYLHKFVAEKNLNRSLPVSCYAMLSPRGEILKCNVTFKNNNFLMLDFDQKIPGLCPRGRYIVLYNKKGLGARVLGGGRVRSSGFFDDENDWRSLPKTKDEEEGSDEESAPKKKDLGF